MGYAGNFFVPATTKGDGLQRILSASMSGDTINFGAPADPTKTVTYSPPTGATTFTITGSRTLVGQTPGKVAIKGLTATGSAIDTLTIQDVGINPGASKTVASTISGYVTVEFKSTGTVGSADVIGTPTGTSHSFSMTATPKPTTPNVGNIAGVTTTGVGTLKVTSGTCVDTFAITHGGPTIVIDGVTVQ